MRSFRNLTKILIFSIGFVFCLSGPAFSTWPEFGLSNDCFLGSAQGTQTTAAVAFDGTNFLVAWEDERESSHRDIFGARVSQNGEILDPAGIPICVSRGTQSAVNVAWGGENYLVVWQDYKDGISSIYGARIDTYGNLLDPDGFLIAGGGEWAMYPAVASDGINFFVVWTHDKPETFYDLYGARVTSDGEILDPDGILICATSRFEVTPSIAYNGSIYFVAWEHDQG